MSFGTKGCMYNCGDTCTGECMKPEEKTAREYNSPIIQELLDEITPEEMEATKARMLQELIDNQEDLDPEFGKIIEDNFWDLVDNQEELDVHSYIEPTYKTGKIKATINVDRVFAVTGVDHGSIVTAKDKKEAIEIFQRHYDGEEILYVKDISDYNLENL